MSEEESRGRRRKLSSELMLADAEAVGEALRISGMELSELRRTVRRWL